MIIIKTKGMGSGMSKKMTLEEIIEYVDREMKQETTTSALATASATPIASASTTSTASISSASPAIRSFIIMIWRCSHNDNNRKNDK